LAFFITHYRIEQLNRYVNGHSLVGQLVLARFWFLLEPWGLGLSYKKEGHPIQGIVLFSRKKKNPISSKSRLNFLDQ
jgi:hypothetical protein